jgi:uncharacterized protein YuzE
MNISYDKATDSLYIHLTDRASVESDEVRDGVVLDFDANCALVGIDVQHASERTDLGSLSLSQSPYGDPVASQGIAGPETALRGGTPTTKDRLTQLRALRESLGPATFAAGDIAKFKRQR